MTKEVELGGQMRPIRFGMAALYKYEEITGKSAHLDFAEMGAGGYKLKTIVNLVYAGLACGYQKSGITIDFDVLDVAEWLGEDQTTIEAVMQLFVESMPGQKNAVPPRTVKGKKAPEA